jgi:hypothetical protein
MDDRTPLLVAGATRGLLRSTKETVAVDTPACRAISFTVGRKRSLRRSFSI